MSAKEKTYYSIRSYFKPVQRKFVADKENLKPTISISKKIKKNEPSVSIRKPFNDLSTNKHFAEDRGKSQLLSYYNTNQQKTYIFTCYSEEIILIPAELECKLIQQTIDNDCMTDNEQVKSAVKSLRISLEKAIAVENEEEEPAT